jgi:type IV secretory pathway component VirB8
MWIVALIIYLIVVPAAFVIGCMLPLLGRRKKEQRWLCRLRSDYVAIAVTCALRCDPNLRTDLSGL